MFEKRGRAVRKGQQESASICKPKKSACSWCYV